MFIFIYLVSDGRRKYYFEVTVQKKRCVRRGRTHLSINKQNIKSGNSHKLTLAKKELLVLHLLFAIFQFSKDSLEMAVILLRNINLR
jgi:hypothetical protein